MLKSQISVRADLQSGRSTSQYEVICQLRFPMIVLVTFAHSYGAVREGFSLLASDWDTFEFLKLLVSQTLVKVAVPVFFIISGYLFFANVDKWDARTYGRKMLRRMKTLLVPYLVWNLLMVLKLQISTFNVPLDSVASLVEECSTFNVQCSMFNVQRSMFWVFWCPAATQTDWFGHEQLMTAPANMPLWFLRDLIVVSLFTPIIYIAVRRLGVWLMALLTIFYLSGVCAFVPGLSAYAVYFFTLGAFLSIRGADLVATFRRYERPAYILTALFAVSMLLTYNFPFGRICNPIRENPCPSDAPFSSLMLAFRLTASVSAFCVADRLLACTSRRIPPVVVSSTYFIYLAHYVFFFSFIDTAFFSTFNVPLFGRICNPTAVQSLHYLLAPLLKAAIFVGLYWIYHRLKVKIS